MKLKFTLLLFFILLITSAANAQQAPQIILQPIDNTVCPGDSAGFIIQATGDDDLNYQWQKDNVDLPGETDTVCFISSAWEPDAGNYTCVVSNQYGADTSNLAILGIDIVLQLKLWVCAK